MTDLQHQRITARDWFLTILFAIGAAAVVFLVLKWAGQADFAVEGAIVSAGSIIGTAILTPILGTFRNKKKTG
jgi:hypothetical protein